MARSLWLLVLGCVLFPSAGQALSLTYQLSFETSNLGVALAGTGTASGTADLDTGPGTISLGPVTFDWIEELIFASEGILFEDFTATLTGTFAGTTLDVTGGSNSWNGVCESPTSIPCIFLGGLQSGVFSSFDSDVAFTSLAAGGTATFTGLLQRGAGAFDSTLEIQFTVVPEPGGLLLAAACAVAVARRRRTALA